MKVGFGSEYKKRSLGTIYSTCILSIMANRSEVWGRDLTQIQKRYMGLTVALIFCPCCLHSSFIPALLRKLAVQSQDTRHPVGISDNP